MAIKAGKQLPTKALIMPLRTILGAFIFSMTAFSAVALYLNLGEGGFSESTPEMVEIYGWILAGLGIALWFASRYVSSVSPNPQMVASLDAPEPVARAMAKYFAETMARAGMAEAFGLLGAVFYLLTSQLFFLAAPLISAILLLRLMPTEAKVRELLRDHGHGGNAGSHTPAIEP